MDDDLAPATMTRVFWRIVPLILIAYLFAYMDRVNISFAALTMNADLKFSATIYGLGGGLFFLGYALFEVPSNLLLVRFGARRWIARIMITWGLLSAAMIFVRTPLEFYGLRFLLGVAEAGFYPGVIYYFSQWFPTAWRGRAVSRFYVATPLASVVMGALSGPLLGLAGVAHLRGWQWLFLGEGVPAALVGLVLLRFLPDTPRAARWLSEPQKAWLEGRLARETQAFPEPEAGTFLAALANPVVLALGAIGCLTIGTAITLHLNVPAVLKEGTGFTPLTTGLLVSLGGVAGAVTMIFAGWFSDRTGDRLRDSAVLSAVMAAGIFGLAFSPSVAFTVVAYMVFAAVCFTVPMLTSAAWADLLHVRQLAVGAALVNTLSQLGAFVGPFAWGAARDATGSFHAGLVGLAILAAVLAALQMGVRNWIRGRRGVSAPALVV